MAKDFGDMDEQPQEVAEKPVRDATDVDKATFRALWMTNPAKYRRIVKERGLEPADIWPNKAQLPENSVLHGYPAGAFGATLPEFGGVRQVKVGDGGKR